MTETTRIPLRSLKKEATLMFLALFYFVIATNTQTGWLFVLSAFLLGLLGLSRALSRRSIKELTLSARIEGEPQRGRPFRLLLTLENANPRPVHEVLVEMDLPDWAQAHSPLRWAVPRLAANSRLETSLSLIPNRRGEHHLPSLSIHCGAPFGLFTVIKTITLDRTFLVYPKLERVPLPASRSRASTALGELTSPGGRGDTHSLRTLREYKAGDDLRQIHWKASAKRGPGLPLLVREHYAPAPNRVLLFLDSSSEVEEMPFEESVVTAASVLWSAARHGTRAALVLCHTSGQWEVLDRWPQQYRALARVKLSQGLPFPRWCEEAEQFFQLELPRNFRGSQPTLVTGRPQEHSSQGPTWFHKILRPNSNQEGHHV